MRSSVRSVAAMPRVRFSHTIGVTVSATMTAWGHPLRVGTHTNTRMMNDATGTARTTPKPAEPAARGRQPIWRWRRPAVATGSQRGGEADQDTSDGGADHGPTVQARVTHRTMRAATLHRRRDQHIAVDRQIQQLPHRQPEQRRAQCAERLTSNNRTHRPEARRRPTPDWPRTSTSKTAPSASLSALPPRYRRCGTAGIAFSAMAALASRPYFSISCAASAGWSLVCTD